MLHINTRCYEVLAQAHFPLEVKPKIEFNPTLEIKVKEEDKVNNGNWNNITFTITIGVVRGCTDDVDDPCGVSIERTIDDKGKTFKVTYNNKSCKTCKKNNCNKNIFFKPSNGHTSFIGSAELCAFIASLMVARMSYPTILS
ncbi:uncharacterized protein LOC100573240 isoform X3 [Acyrthosiphon pisum]|uniref:Uncharacterized protein n=1 Tax=Acyrthosiphon pisum TaxID=7029 RepID=A0A8R2D2M8_ACYPI|nr:uncharacterized protein LOC100573240 isoform X3 [Acyrthosiphon pisum]|eukprot:XP_016658432.1 PREDICTED: uncharacterized protein LOC100573240 isoform X3 [Acyrthosiphon pisum]